MMIAYEIRSIEQKGMGLFTKVEIKAGQVLFKIDLSDHVEYTPAQLEKALTDDPSLDGDRADYVGHGKYVIEDTPAAYMNHSCQPNCGFKMHSNLKYDVIALMNIPANSELTHDYTACSVEQFGGNTTWTLQCNCGCRKCRGTVTGDYFTLPFYWQVQNYSFLSPSIKRKYRKRFSGFQRLAQIKIRKLTRQDCKDLARIHIDAWKQAYKNIVPSEYLSGLSYNRLEAGCKQKLQKGIENTFIAKAGSDIYGFVTLGDCRDRDLDKYVVGEIWGIYLDPEMWRRKIGSYLCSWAEAELKAQGYEIIALWAFKQNKRAHKFYQKMGFRPDGATKTLNPGKKLTAIRFLKKV